MECYIFAADLYCEDCAAAIKARLALPPGYDADNESTWDSDDYPKGPYPEDGGGESDAPQHCGGCGVFLENPLTADGLAYVAEALENGYGAADVLATWREFYRDELTAAGYLDSSE